MTGDVRNLDLTSASAAALDRAALRLRRTTRRLWAGAQVRLNLAAAAPRSSLVGASVIPTVRYRDVPHGLLWLMLVAPFGTYAVARASEKLTRPDATAVPAVALSLALIAPAITTVSNQLSRSIERRADAFALGLTGEPDAMVGFERRITLQNVGDPDPPRWQQVVLGTHPPTMERIGQALASRNSPGDP